VPRNQARLSFEIILQLSSQVSSVNGNPVEIFFSDSSFAPNVQILKTEEIYEIHAKILKPKQHQRLSWLVTLGTRVQFKVTISSFSTYKTLFRQLFTLPNHHIENSQFEFALE
jgi:hypothetical protein